MTVCLCGRGADLDKVNKYLSFSPFDIILISEYVDDMKLPDCECYYIAKSEIKNTKSIILQISRKRHLQYTSVVLCKDILLDSKLSKIIFKCSVKNITFVLNINRMFDLHYLDDCRKNISTETHQIIEVFSGRKLPQYHWLFAVLPSVLYLDDDVLSAQLSCDKSCAKIKTSNYEFEIHICDDSSLADTIVQINGTKICEINYYSAIINTFDENSKPYADACASCASCPHKTLIQKNVYKKIYHNEKNRYGYRPMLKANAIKLFLLLHFYHPDNNGIVYNLEACELASVIGCNVRTVWNNLKVLEEYTYISYSKNEYGLINVILNDYENYYLPANKGGRGFLVMSKELLTKLNSTDSLVSLRIFIRELLSLDSPELKGVASVDYKNIRDIRNTLPSYCKPSVIKAKLTKNSDIFNVTFKDDVVRFEIDKAYIPKNQKAYAHEEYVGILQNFIWEFNQNVAYVNSGETVSAKFSSFFNIKTSVASYKLMKLTDIEIDDIASLSLHYSYEIVMNALSVVYKEYYMYEKTINNLAGLMSTIIRAQFNNLKKAA